MAFFHVFARFRPCFRNFAAEGDEITARTPVHHERVLVSENIHKKGKKKIINRSQWHFKNYFFARFRLSVEDYVAEGDKIKGYRSKKFI